jgi:hypothetical protein
MTTPDDAGTRRTSMSQHAPEQRPKPYETREPYAHTWTLKAYQLLVAGQLHARLRVIDRIETATVEGPCPRCGDQIHDTQVFTASAEGTRTANVDITGLDYVPVTVTCSCGETHPGRPDGQRGCGITFRLELLREAQ